MNKSSFPRKELLAWFVAMQLQEYTHLFDENQEFAWLDKIDRRYAWIKKHLLDFESKFGKIFPQDWELSERIAVQFCHITRDDLAKLMHKRTAEMDVKLLLYAIQRTVSFESLLAKRFTGVTLEEAGRSRKRSAAVQQAAVEAVPGNPFEEEAAEKVGTGGDLVFFFVVAFLRNFDVFIYFFYFDGLACDC